MSIDKIVCVGKNYLDHAKELGDAVPEKPVLFLKPPSVLKQAQSWRTPLHVEFPSEEDVVHPECEIVLRLSKDGYKMSITEARQAISDVTLGLDMTLRTRQSELKKQGHPWTTAKVFPDAAILGPWIPYHSFIDYKDTLFQLCINKELKQAAKGSDMMMQPEELLVYISHFFPLKTGDIIYTGTPAGVSAILKNSVATLVWGMYSYDVIWDSERGDLR